MKRRYKEAQELILSMVKPGEPLEVSLEEAWERVLAQDIFSPMDLPPVDTSAMDGYAIMARDTHAPPVVLPVKGEAPAGCAAPPPLEPGKAMLVTTGGPIPPGADAVIKVEEVEERGSSILISRRVEKGELINTKGQEIKKGDPLLPRGTLLDPRKIALLASVGLNRVRIHPPPRAALFSSGDEILEPGQPYQAGRVYNTNRYIVEGLLKREGVQINYLGILPDAPQIQRDALARAMERYPLIITTGAVSRGKYDHLRQVMTGLDLQIHITSTNIKPGHPLVFGTRGEVLFFGLPGYPSATLVNTLVYLLPAVRKMKGVKDCIPSTIKARTREPLKSRKGKVYFIRVNLQRKDGEWMVSSTGSQLTSVYITSALAQGLAILPEEMDLIKPGEKVEVLPLG